MKKNLRILFVCVLTFALALCLFACNSGTTEDPKATEAPTGEATDAPIEGVAAECKTHKYVVDTAVAATCTDAGKTEGKHCSVCGKVDVEQKDVPATGHTEVEDIAVTSTCTTEGKTAGVHCSVCNLVLTPQAAVEKVSHNYGVDHICSACGVRELFENNGVKLGLINSDAEYEVAGYADGSDATEIVIPNSYDGKPVTKIGANAFKGNQILASITIPDSVIDIDATAFEDCGALATITAGEGNTAFSSEKGILYTKDKKEIVLVPKALSGKVEISSQVEIIGASAFYGCNRITDIVIPTSLKTVGEDAFAGCGNLVSVHIIDLASWCNIDFENEYANPLSKAHNLYVGENLADLSTIDGMAFIGEYAFAYCNNLKVTTVNVERIGEYAFLGCDKLTDVTLGTAVEIVYGDAFKGCSSIKKVNAISVADWCDIDFYSINSNPLYKAGYLYVDGELADVTNISGVEKVGDLVFVGCKNADGKKITLGSGVETVGEGAFFSTGIIGVTLGNDVTDIEEFAFYRCNKLSEVTFGNKVSSIGGAAFMHCSSLTELTLPESLETIWNLAFSNCSGIKSVIIPDGVDEIDEGAFGYCEALETVKLGTSVRTINNGAFANCKNLTSIIFGGAEKIIAESAFANDTKLTNVVLPSTLEEIRKYAFENCTGITELALPDSVKTIGTFAFKGCTELTKLTGGSNVEQLGEYAFLNCPKLQLASEGGYIYIGKVLVKCNEDAEKLSVKAGTLTIGVRAFNSCNKLTEIEIPVTVAHIEKYAFGNCKALKTIKYGGTEAEWENIEKSADWKEGASLNLQVIATDTVTVK